ncbi:MAG: hypothetical protein PHQ52_03445 [Candidatus Omnitrophica bacterium]|nr:hypothetical protein [Candidatus Omnitrophota bacterium]
MKKQYSKPKIKAVKMEAVCTDSAEDCSNSFEKKDRHEKTI